MVTVMSRLPPNRQLRQLNHPRAHSCESATESHLQSGANRLSEAPRPSGHRASAFQRRSVRAPAPRFARGTPPQGLPSPSPGDRSALHLLPSRSHSLQASPGTHHSDGSGGTQQVRAAVESVPPWVGHTRHRGHNAPSGARGRRGRRRCALQGTTAAPPRAATRRRRAWFRRARNRGRRPVNKPR